MKLTTLDLTVAYTREKNAALLAAKTVLRQVGPNVMAEVKRRVRLMGHAPRHVGRA